MSTLVFTMADCSTDVHRPALIVPKTIADAAAVTAPAAQPLPPHTMKWLHIDLADTASTFSFSFAVRMS
jgi:hypothetical protein